MKTVWKNGLTDDAKKRLEQDFIGSAPIRERLSKILTDKIEHSWTSSVGAEGYTNPNWAYLQADARGYERALKEIISLITEK